MNPTTTQPLRLIPPPISSGIVDKANSRKALTERKVAYVINDKYFQGFEVLKSANAWWMDRPKVDALIQNLKNGYNQLESRIHAGITEKEYRYFKEMHPAFSHVIDACELHLNMVAETGNAKLLYDGDGTQIRWFLERRKPDKYGRYISAGEGGGPVINNFGTIISAARPVSSKMMDSIKKDEAL